MSRRSIVEANEKARAARRRWLKRGAGALLIGAMAAVLWQSPRWLAKLPGMRIDEVRIVTPLARVDADALKAEARKIQGDLITVSLPQVSHGFERVAWVRQARVRRAFPGALEVAIEEHQVLARWGAKGLVNTQGEVFRGESDADLPLFTGPAGSEADLTAMYPKMRDALASVSRDVRELRVNARRALTVVLDEGSVLELGRVDAERRLERFIAARRALGDAVLAGQHVDLRYANGFAVRGVRPADNKPRT